MNDQTIDDLAAKDPNVDKEATERFNAYLAQIRELLRGEPCEFSHNVLATSLAEFLHHHASPREAALNGTIEKVHHAWSILDRAGVKPFMQNPHIATTPGKQ